MPAARGHHRGRGSRGHETWRIERVVGVTLAAGVEAVGNGAVRPLISLKHRTAAPPAEGPQSARLTLDCFGEHESVAQAIADFGTADPRSLVVDSAEFEERSAS